MNVYSLTKCLKIISVILLACPLSFFLLWILPFTNPWIEKCATAAIQGDRTVFDPDEADFSQSVMLGPDHKIREGNTIDYEIVLRNTGSKQPESVDLWNAVDSPSAMLASAPELFYDLEDRVLRWHGTVGPGEERRFVVRLVTLPGSAGTIVSNHASIGWDGKTKGIQSDIEVRSKQSNARILFAVGRIGLSILLDKPDKSYESGEIIKGQVKVAVERQIPAAALLLVLYCKGLSEWKSNTATVEREKAERKLFNGPRTHGEYTYPFEIVSPPGPGTYKGHVFDVTWHLGARARASGEEDAMAETEIVILPKKEISQGLGTKSSREVVYTESPRSLKGFLGFSLALLLVGIVVGWRNSPFAEGTDSGVFFGGIIPMLLGFAMLFFTTWQALVNKRIKKVEVRLGFRQASPGEKIPCSVIFQGNISFEVDKISVVLRGEEIVDFRRRKNIKFHKQLLYENKQEFSLAVQQTPTNVPLRAQGEILVPVGIPYSIDLMESEEGMVLTWQIEFNIEMKKWPDWMHLETISVQP